MIGELLEKCIECKKHGIDVFLDYSPHVNRISLGIHKDGWISGEDPCERIGFYLDCGDFQQDVIGALKRLDEIIEEKPQQASHD